MGEWKLRNASSTGKIAIVTRCHCTVSDEGAATTAVAAAAAALVGSRPGEVSNGNGNISQTVLAARGTHPCLEFLESVR
ncbi:hypothetical protein ElyMa_002294000 [Elysia marginata]|uniref:Uncharacterized protein n=1 Tax=Elysia marginata TaxID=1093978 RepID=A0AAV4G1X1_9GAST|nr:hypothetical protein ElyMa_002294000 [Elysia marginata]